MEPTYYRAKAPLRVGLVGGGTDVDPYATINGGKVFNTTIGKYAYCTITPTGDSSMSIHSTDYGKYEAPLDGGPLPLDGNMDLIKVVTNHFQITEGFKMFLQSDAPPGSGLGGSSAVIVSIIAAVSRWQDIRMTAKEIAELAIKLERQEIGLKGGKQDQYTAAFGGFNVMKFGSHGVDVNRVRVDDDIANELEYRSVLCYTGTTRESADVIDSQIKKLEQGQNIEALDATKALVGPMSDALSKGDISLAGEILNESWMLKKQFSEKVTNPYIDKMYEAAMVAGAIGGKVSGAGGGGFMYFICGYDTKYDVAKVLQKLGARVTDFTFEPKGVITWSYHND